jgi:hypothetical protein
MAIESQIASFQKNVERFQSINSTKVLRPELGALSLLEAVGPILAGLKNKISFIQTILEHLPDALLSNFSAQIDAVINICSQITQIQDDQQFVNQRATNIAQLSQIWDAVRRDWPPFVTTAVEVTGILSGINELQASVKTLFERQLDELRTRGEDLLNIAKEQAAKIEERARLTAAKISVKAAQDQFDDGQRDLDRKAYVWSGLALLTFSSFICFTVFLLRHPPIFDPKASGQLLIVQDAYFTILRVAVLAAIGALGTFFLRMARAHFHMAAYNAHRRRVANSMAAFVEAANSLDQRDLILGRLVDAVVQFGESGILDKQNDTMVPVPTIAIDALTKNLNSGK